MQKNYKETTLRKKAREAGYSIHKGFVHQIGNGAVAPGRSVGYEVVDETTGYAVWGSYDMYFDHLWSLEDVEVFLKGVYEDHGLKF